jgi:hypothetical protein
VLSKPPLGKCSINIISTLNEIPADAARASILCETPWGRLTTSLSQDQNLADAVRVGVGEALGDQYLARK